MGEPPRDPEREAGADAGGAPPEREGGAAAPPQPVERLAAIVRGEATRGESESRIRPNPARVAAGWEPRFVIERARVADLVALYEARGFEVALEPVPPELVADECGDCRLVAALEYVRVYTRRR